ncbi:LANO_0A01046g1_1 [Lachancea nothofagi CBS 11611]|uniref:LANO_0A01046g1_1 n=1 Tax=Lachancea nothofagi CBS 11611 TaxID=1266666 RepID=A0A1G4IMB8_9SACH|nr:LANO_0A01046g1_1 [Lachancea nothofagi CBS 11611]
MSKKPVEMPAARFVRQFQAEDLDENSDYALLKHTQAHLQNQVLQKKYLTKQLQLLYAQLDKTRNYQEFVDTLMGSRQLLSEIFALEKHSVRQTGGRVRKRNGSSRKDLAPIPSVPWHQYGVDVEQYLLASDEGRDLVHQSGWVFHDM